MYKLLLRRLRRFVSPALARPDLVPARDAEAAVDLLYRFLLARAPDESGRAFYLQSMRQHGLTLREVACQVATSDEFQTRLRNSLASDDGTARAGAVAPADAVVDVRQLSRTLSVEELARTAEDYYRTARDGTERFLAKPFAGPHDAPHLLACFAHLLGGMRLAPGMTVLDFGAGTGWTSRALAQLGCAVIAVDVSATALQIGRELFARVPPVGDKPAPRFLVFDGRRLDLPDGSVDRIICVDAFNHVPNPGEVMVELGRVLRHGGIAGFSEPGPHHSTASGSQYEMKNYVAFENDVVMPEVWRWAQAAGFTALELAVFSSESYRVSLGEFEDLVAGGKTLHAYGERLRAYLSGHQTFFLSKGEARRDSREAEGLRAEIAVRLDGAEVGSGERIRGVATVQNVGTAAWRSSTPSPGGVWLGVHLRGEDGRPLRLEFARVALAGTMIPGELQEVPLDLEPPPPGTYLLEFDLVSEAVTWFEMNGSPTATVRVTVR